MKFNDFRNVVEGKSFKRNDEEGDKKKKQDEQRRKEREEKKRTDESKLAELTAIFESEFAAELGEGKSFKRNKDEDADDKKKEDKQRRDNQKGKNEPVEEGKSYKRNDDESKSKKEKDEERRKARDDKQRTDEASDISFNDAKAEMPRVKGQLGKMSPFHPDYVKTKAQHDRLQDRLARNGGDDEVDEAAGEQTFEVHGVAGVHSKPFRKAFKSEAAMQGWLDKYSGNIEVHGIAYPEGHQAVDEASDISFNDAKNQMPGVKDKLGNMSPFHPDYIKTKAHHDRLDDRLSRMKDDDLEEDDEDGGEALEEAPIQVGDHIAYTFAHLHPPKIFTGTVKGIKGEYCKIEWDEKNGAYAGPSEVDCQDNGIRDQVYELHWARKTGDDQSQGEAGMEESYVDDTAGYSGDTQDVVEHKIGDTVTVKEGKFAGLTGTVIKEGPGPYVAVQLAGGRQIRYGHDELVNESYVSGSADEGSDDVIEDANMEDCIMPRNQSKSLADEVETTDKDGKKVDVSDIERMKQLAGMNKI